MAFLILAFLATGLAVFGSSDCHAGTIPHLLETYDLTGSAAAGPGNNYEVGGQTAFYFGDSDDLSNHTADLHFNYTEDYTPSDPDDTSSPIKQSNNWAGGLKIDLWQGGSLGFDLDALNDSFENLDSNGQKVTLGVDPFNLSYRFAQTRVNSTFLLGASEIQGGVIYQHTFELDYSWALSDASSLSFDGSYSIFNPSAAEFATLLQAPTLTSLSNFQDTLESFELWKVGGEWTQLWGPVLDSAVSAHISHLVITSDQLLDTNVALGFQLNREYHLQAGWEYTDQPGEVQSLFSLELRYSWDRAAYEVRASSTSGTPGHPSPIEKSLKSTPISP